MLSGILIVVFGLNDEFLKFKNDWKVIDFIRHFLLNFLTSFLILRVINNCGFTGTSMNRMLKETNMSDLL